MLMSSSVHDIIDFSSDLNHVIKIAARRGRDSSVGKSCASQSGDLASNPGWGFTQVTG